MTLHATNTGNILQYHDALLDKFKTKLTVETQEGQKKVTLLGENPHEVAIYFIKESFFMMIPFKQNGTD